MAFGLKLKRISETYYHGEMDDIEKMENAKVFLEVKLTHAKYHCLPQPADRDLQIRLTSSFGKTACDPTCPNLASYEADLPFSHFSLFFLFPPFFSFLFPFFKKLRTSVEESGPMGPLDVQYAFGWTSD